MRGLKAVSILLAVAFCVSLAGTVWASGEPEPEPEPAPLSGDCGDGVTWTLSDDGVLTISGEGEAAGSPW